MPGPLTITWEPGSDTLLGTCHCGASHASQDPVEAWSWLLACPEGHVRDGEPR